MLTSHTSIRRRIALRIATAALTSMGMTGAALAFSSAIPASAAETHQNCLTVDDSGNITSVTPSCSQTTTSRGGEPQVQPDSQNPCTRDFGDFTMIPKQSTLHVNVDKDGDIWVSGTYNGTATFTPYDSSAPSGVGTWTDWFGFGMNNRNNTQTSTFDLEVHLSNGQTIIQHEVAHDSFSATGLETVFDNAGGTC